MGNREEKFVDYTKKRLKEVLADVELTGLDHAFIKQMAKMAVTLAPTASYIDMATICSRMINAAGQKKHGDVEGEETIPENYLDEFGQWLLTLEAAALAAGHRVTRARRARDAGAAGLRRVRNKLRALAIGREK